MVEVIGWVERNEKIGKFDQVLENDETVEHLTRLQGHGIGSPGCIGVAIKVCWFGREAKRVSIPDFVETLSLLMLLWHGKCLALVRGSLANEILRIGKSLAQRKLCLFSNKNTFRKIKKIESKLGQAYEARMSEASALFLDTR